MKTGNYLSTSFPIENGLKKGDALLPLLFNFALEYAIRKVQETTYICQSVAEVYLTGVDPLGAVSHRFILFYYLFNPSISYFPYLLMLPQ